MLHLSPETEFLAQRLAEAQQVTPEDAIRMALEQRAREQGLLGDGRRREVDANTFAARQALTDAFVAKIASMPDLDPRSPREIMDDIDPL